jgi:hypothetical protein
MQLDLSPAEADFLAIHLRRYAEHVQIDLAHTDRRDLQHSLAGDLERLRAILGRLERGAK